MNANEIFQNMIGSELEGLVVKYTPYNENFDVHPYRQSITTDFEKQFADLLFDSIIFYAFEKEEIEKDYIKGRFKDLRKASRAAYEMRVPKTEKECDGLFGELALDSFLKCFFPNMESYIQELSIWKDTLEKAQMINVLDMKLEDMMGCCFLVKMIRNICGLGK